MKLAAVLLAVAALLAACGGSSSPGDEDAKANFRVYGKAETQRDAAEAELNKAFREISSAAQAHDRAGVMAAVGRGEDAVSTIDTALAVQIEAATALAGYAPIREHGGRLRDALEDTKAGTDLVDQQLAIARRDPFLDDAANLREVQRLSSESV